MSVAPLASLSRNLLRRRWIAGAIAIALLAISLALAWQRERADSIEQARQVSAQADILAGSVAGALAFDDLDTTREYLDALKVNEEIQAAAIYGADGALIAGFAREGDPLPRTVQDQDPVFAGSQLAVVQPVRQETLFLGFVYLRTAVEPEKIAWLVELKGWKPAEAYVFCSLACDLRVTQLVDGNKGIHAMVARSLIV